MCNFVRFRPGPARGTSAGSPLGEAVGDDSRHVDEDLEVGARGEEEIEGRKQRPGGGGSAVIGLVVQV